MVKKDKNQKRTIITVMGVGGGGNNAVNHMYLQDFEGITFMVSDTDRHQLDESPVPDRLLLGANTTLGQNACNDPEVARRAAEESEPIYSIFARRPRHLPGHQTQHASRQPCLSQLRDLLHF